jgi:hypothetical protein
MTTTAPHTQHDTTPERVLLRASERSEQTWQLGVTTGVVRKNWISIPCKRVARLQYT